MGAIHTRPSRAQSVLRRAVSACSPSEYPIETGADLAGALLRRSWLRSVCHRATQSHVACPKIAEGWHVSPAAQLVVTGRKKSVMSSEVLLVTPAPIWPCIS